MKFALVLVHLNAGGYDTEGCYFGHRDGERLYSYASDDAEMSFLGKAHHGIECGYVRAKDREDAKRQVKKRYPSATFYR